MPHPAINTTKESAYADMAKKHRFYITYLVKRPAIAKAELEKMNNKVARNKDGKVLPRGMEAFERMEKFRVELSTERLRLKNESR